MRLVQVTLLAITVGSLAGVSSARACSPPVDGVDDGGTFEDPLVLTLLVTGAVDATFLALDVGYGAQGRTLPHGAALVQGIVGVANLAGSLYLGFAGVVGSASTCSDNRDGLLLGSALSMNVLGGWFLSHALWSSRVTEDQGVQPTVSVSDTHGIVGLRGSF